jgi:hypothetical protein
VLGQAQIEPWRASFPGTRRPGLGGGRRDGGQQGPTAPAPPPAGDCIATEAVVDCLATEGGDVLITE